MKVRIILIIIVLIVVIGCRKEKFKKGDYNIAFGHVFDKETKAPLTDINVNFIYSVNTVCSKNCWGIYNTVKTNNKGYFELKISSYEPGFGSTPMLYVVDEDFVYNDYFQSFNGPINEYKIYLDKKDCNSLKVTFRIFNSWQARNNDTITINTSCGNFLFTGLVDTTIECTLLNKFKFVAEGYFTKEYNNYIREYFSENFNLKCNHENKIDFTY